MAEEYLPAAVGERVRDLRREKGLTQEELAGIIGISRSTVNRIESESKISADDALEIAKYFNVSVDFVLAKTDDPQVINYDLKVIGLSRRRQKSFIQIRLIPMWSICLLKMKSSEILQSWLRFILKAMAKRREERQMFFIRRSARCLKNGEITKMP